MGNTLDVIRENIYSRINRIPTKSKILDEAFDESDLVSFSHNYGKVDIGTRRTLLTIIPIFYEIMDATFPADYPYIILPIPELEARALYAEIREPIDPEIFWCCPGEPWDKQENSQWLLRTKNGRSNTKTNLRDFHYVSQEIR